MFISLQSSLVISTYPLPDRVVLKGQETGIVER